MPTGYTAKLYNGDQSVRDFILKCSGAFGAHIDSRDSNESLPQEYKVDKYYTESLEEAKKDFNDFLKKSPEQLKEDFENEKKKDLKQLKDWAKEEDSRKVRYENMKYHVKQWSCEPAYDHLKKFMIEQLENSIKWDCNYCDYNKQFEKINNRNFEKWVSERTVQLSQNIKTALDSLQKETKRIKEANDWISGLYVNLKYYK